MSEIVRKMEILEIFDFFLEKDSNTFYIFFYYIEVISVFQADFSGRTKLSTMSGST